MKNKMKHSLIALGLIVCTVFPSVLPVRANDRAFAVNMGLNMAESTCNFFKENPNLLPFSETDYVSNLLLDRIYENFTVQELHYFQTVDSNKDNTLFKTYRQALLLCVELYK